MPNSLKRQLVVHENGMKRLGEKLEGERALWKSPAAKKRLERGDPASMHAAEMLDIMVKDPAHLQCWTGVDSEKFAFRLGNYVETIERTGMTPLFRNCASTASDRGNGRKLEHGQSPHLFLVRIRTSLTQDQLA